MKKAFVLLAMIALSMTACTKSDYKEQNKKEESPLLPIYDDPSGKWYYIDKSWNVVVEPQFDYACFFSEGMAAIKTGSQWGFIDTKGKLVVEPLFEWVGSFSEGLARVKIDDKWGYIDTKGKLVVKPQFGWEGDFSQGMAAVKHNDKWGYINKKGKFVIEPQFDQAGGFSEGLARVKNNDKWGYIDMKGEIMVEPQFDWEGDYSQGLAPVRLNGKWGYIDMNGKLVVEPQFDWASEYYDGFIEGMASVKIGKKYGYIDKSGKVVGEVDPSLVPKVFYNGIEFSEGLATVKKDGYYGYIDITGKIVVPPRFSDAADFHDGLAAVLVGNKWGYIDKNGIMVVSPKYDGASDFSEGKAAVSISMMDTSGRFNEPNLTEVPAGYEFPIKREPVYHEFWGYIDKTGAFVVDPQFDGAGAFSEGMAFVFKKEKASGFEYGYIDKIGNVVWKNHIGDVYYYKRELQSFSEGMKSVIINGKWGFIDKNGTVVVEPKYNYASDFSEGLARVEIGKTREESKWGYIDKKGIVVEPKYDYASDFSEGLAAVSLDGETCGYIDKMGKEVIEPQYEMARDFSNGLAYVENNGKWGLIDKTGKYAKPLNRDLKFEFRGFSEDMANIQGGFIDKSGQIVLCPFDGASDFCEGLAWVWIVFEKIGIIDKTGKWLYYLIDPLLLDPDVIQITENTLNQTLNEQQRAEQIRIESQLYELEDRRK